MQFSSFSRSRKIPVFFLRKLGLGLPDLGPKNKDTRVWLHAVSVGEIISCIPLVELSETRGVEVIVSTDTYPAYRLARSKLKREILCFPLDLEWVSGRFFQKYRPDMVLICEVEIWPAFAWKASRSGIPLYSISGRLVEKDFNGYWKLRGLFRQVLPHYTGIFMQSQMYAERLRRLFDHPNVRVMGSLKFDAAPQPGSIKAARLLPRGYVICAASTHRGDEEFIVRAFKKLLTRRPDAKLIIAPRHIQRTRQIEKIIHDNGLGYTKRSENRPGKTPVFILDSIGELDGLYGATDLVIMGGSFSAKNGGHNVIEPSLHGKCVLCGPHMENFVDIHQLFLFEYALFSTTMETLARDLLFLSDNPDEARKVGKRALSLIRSHRGASRRIADAVLEDL